jgi:hypothetical protein
VDQICGGFAGFQCKAGLECRYANGKTTPPPNTADAAGISLILKLPMPALLHNGRPLNYDLSFLLTGQLI